MPFCMECGKKLPDGAVFCSECGTKQSRAEVQKTQPVILVAPAEPVADIPVKPLILQADTVSTEITAEQKTETHSTDSDISCLPLTGEEIAPAIEPNNCEFSEESEKSAIPSEIVSLSEPVEKTQDVNVGMADVSADVEQQGIKNAEISLSCTSENEKKQEEAINADTKCDGEEDMPSQEYDFKEPISIFCQRDFSYVFEKEDIKKNRVISALCYFPPFFFILLLFKSKSRFCLFHANQGLLLTLTTLLWTLFNSIIGTIIRYNFVVVTSWGYSALSTAGYVLTAVIWGIQAIVTLTWFYLGLIDTMNGRAKKLPLIGRINLIFK